MTMHATLAGRLGRGLMLLAPLMLHTAAAGQERPKVEIVPDVPLAGYISYAALSPKGTHVGTRGMGTIKPQSRVQERAAVPRGHGG